MGNVMKQKTWIKRIKEACVDAGTYRPYFDNVITTLAGILERRDEAEEYYTENGGTPIVKYTNKSGAVNLVTNPALALWDNLNKSALAYWRDLGLTPAGLKKIDDTALKSQKKDAFADALSSIIG